MTQQTQLPPKFIDFEAITKTPISEVSEHCRLATQRRIRQHAKPRGSLGRLEDLACTIAAIQHTTKPCVKPRVAQMFCGDHGVAEEGVSVFPPETTWRVAKAAAAGAAAINAFAREVDCDVQVVDVGIRDQGGQIAGTICSNLMQGTANIAAGPAMNRAQAQYSIIAGANVALSAVAQRYRTIVVGEMGNSNTTVASALLASLTGLHAEEVVGTGTGISDIVLIKKITIVIKALELNYPNRADPIDCLAKVGGLELGAMTGAIITAAMGTIPCVIDGFISSVSALLATRIRPEIQPYLIFSHLSSERGHRVLLRQMNATPLIDLGFRLGEGTGGIACLPLLDLSCALVHGIKTFDECGIPSPYEETAPK